MPETPEANSSTNYLSLWVPYAFFFSLWSNYIFHGLFSFGISSSACAYFCNLFLFFFFYCLSYFAPTLISQLNLSFPLTGQWWLRWNVECGEVIPERENHKVLLLKESSVWTKALLRFSRFRLLLISLLSLWCSHK